jgi:hypothetical protein
VPAESVWTTVFSGQILSSSRARAASAKRKSP